MDEQSDLAGPLPGRTYRNDPPQDGEPPDWWEEYEAWLDDLNSTSRF